MDEEATKHVPLVNRANINQETSRSRRCKTCKTNLQVLSHIINAMERIAFYGIVYNLILYLTKKPLNWEFSNASIMPLILYGIAYIMSWFGGLLGDSPLGKYRTIVVSFIVYIVGYAIFPFLAYYESSVPDICRKKSQAESSFIGITSEPCSTTIFVSAVLVGVSSGSFRANIKPFGAVQGKEIRLFEYFSWHYWSTNLASLVGIFLIAWLQQNVSFFYGYLVSGSMLVGAFVLTLASFPCYSVDKQDDSKFKTPFKIATQVLSEAIWRLMPGTWDNFERHLNDQSNAVSNQTSVNFGAQLPTNQEASAAEATSFIDRMKKTYGHKHDGKLVEDFKSLKKLILLFLCMMPFWIVYFQTQTSYLVQGLHMNLMIGKKLPYMIPAVWLSSINHICVLITILVIRFIKLPCLERITPWFTPSKRILLGMFLSSMSAFVAGGVESWRLSILFGSSSTKYINQTIDNTTYLAADLHFTWQIPQYVLIGLGEVCCSVTCLYLAYKSAPESMQSFIMGLNYFFMGVSSFLVTFLIKFSTYMIYSSSDSEDINCPNCHLDRYFYMIGVCQLSWFIVLLVLIMIDKIDINALEKPHVMANANDQEPANEIRSEVD